VAAMLRLAFYLLFLLVFLWSGLRMLNATDAEATTISAVVVALLAASAALARRSLISSRYGGQRVQRLLVALWSGGLAFFAAATLRVWLDLPYPAVLAAGVAVAAFGAVAYRRQAGRLGLVQLSMSAVQPLSSAQARTLEADARRAMARYAGHTDRYLVAQLNRARALLWSSMLSDAREVLAASRALVEEVLQHPGADRRQLLDAAAELVSTVESYARRTGDGRDYPIVLQIFSDLADGVPEARAKLSECRGDYELFLGDMVLEEARTPEEARPMVQHYLNAVDHLRTASKEAPTTDFRLVTRARAAAAECQVTVIDLAGELTGIEANEQECRAAFARFRRGGADWTLVGIALASCVVAKAEFQLGAGVDGEVCAALDEAEQLCHRLLRRPSDYEPVIRQMLAGLLRTKADVCV
jgi:hypothetical protein